MTNNQRLHLIVGYDGRGFSGWQSQADKNAVQDHLENAFLAICGQRIVVQGSGRTDAGVHALAQSAHVDVPGEKLPLEKWRAALNAHLPREIRVKEVRAVPPGFHARFDVRGKRYQYRIFHEQWLDPLEIGRAWHLYAPLDLAAMEAAARLLTGRHDFRAFAANRRNPPSSTIREVRRIQISRSKKGQLLVLTFDGEGFLYKMVRMLTAMIVRVGQGKTTLAEVERYLTDPGRAKSTYAAPADGLYLVKVHYGRPRRTVRLPGQ